MSLCSSCRASIIWAVTDNGKRMPLDVQVDLAGEFWLEAGATKGTTIAHAVRSVAMPPGAPRYRSHFATCPHAGQHRKEKGGQHGSW